MPNFKSNGEWPHSMGTEISIYYDFYFLTITLCWSKRTKQNRASLIDSKQNKTKQSKTGSGGSSLLGMRVDFFLLWSWLWFTSSAEMLMNKTPCVTQLIILLSKEIWLRVIWSDFPFFFFTNCTDQSNLLWTKWCIGSTTSRQTISGTRPRDDEYGKWSDKDSWEGKK